VRRISHSLFLSGWREPIAEASLCDVTYYAHLPVPSSAGSRFTNPGQASPISGEAKIADQFDPLLFISYLCISRGTTIEFVIASRFKVRGSEFVVRVRGSEFKLSLLSLTHRSSLKAEL
jgi:hypothetical protein